MRTFLFSIDLEDIRFRMPDGSKYKERTPQMTYQILDWLDSQKVKCTFFTVGDIAENYPEIIQEVTGRGHEIGCHSHRHVTLDLQSPEEFKKDLDLNIEALVKAGAEVPVGYRAPNFSLIEKTLWVYPILKEAGIVYSSSVLPAVNTLFGWEGFGLSAREVEGVFEMPVSLAKFASKKVPFAGGVYFRVLPFSWVKKNFQRAMNFQDPVVSYMHPYDFDAYQEKFMQPGINESKFYNWLMYYNRKNLFSRLDKITSNWDIITFKDWMKQRKNV